MHCILKKVTHLKKMSCLQDEKHAIKLARQHRNRILIIISIRIAHKKYNPNCRQKSNSGSDLLFT